MEMKEIKKAYQKMSRQLKKQGLNYTCVMNARQQALGTATICIKFVMDYEAEIKKAQAALADTEKIEKEVRQNMKDTARMIPTWRKWAEESSNTEFWKELVEAWDAGTYEDRKRKEIIGRREAWLKDAQERLDKNGTLAEQYEKARQEYEELKATAPVAEFLNLVNGTTEMEYRNEGSGQVCYLRFKY